MDYTITFFYYPDLATVALFYERTLGFELVLDQGMARIYRVGANSYFGIVDGHRGHLKDRPQSAVLLTIVVLDVPAWHARMKAAGVKGLSEVLTGTYCEHFFFEDPHGYAIEIQRVRNPDVAKLFASRSA
jgi:catechol 2,3-dioxygenase-like lactoylglutathione lyase family enzyme